jgi:hypothetical protein
VEDTVLESLAKALDRQAAAVEKLVELLKPVEYEQYQTASGDRAANALIRAGYEIVGTAPVDPRSEKKRQQDESSGSVFVPTVYVMGRRKGTSVEPATMIPAQIQRVQFPQPRIVPARVTVPPAAVQSQEPSSGGEQIGRAVTEDIAALVKAGRV